MLETNPRRIHFRIEAHQHEVTDTQAGDPEGCLKGWLGSHGFRGRPDHCSSFPELNFSPRKGVDITPGQGMATVRRVQIMWMIAADELSQLMSDERDPGLPKQVAGRTIGGPDAEVCIDKDGPMRNLFDQGQKLAPMVAFKGVEAGEAEAVGGRFFRTSTTE